MSQYATPEETAALVRQATPDEKWLYTELDRIDINRHEMGAAGDTAALEKLALELRNEITMLRADAALAPIAGKTPVDCDCLIDCGDDPWLADGRAYPCKHRVEQQARAQAFAAQSARVNAIIAQHAAADIYSLVEHLHAEVTRLQAEAAP